MNETPTRRVRVRLAVLVSHDAFAVGYFLLLSLLLFYPLLDSGYLLTLDMIFAPTADYLQFGLTTKGPLYYGRLPFLAVLDAAALVAPDWLIQKVILVCLPVCCGWSMVRACRDQPRVAALFAGTLYAFNPFVYVRLLAGHWYFLIGYAFVPLAVVSLSQYLDGGRRRTLLGAVGWTTLVSVFDPHATVLVAVAGGCLFVTHVVSVLRHHQHRPLLVRRIATFAAGALLVNAYWLFPALAAGVTGGTRLTTISEVDLTVFSAGGTIVGNVPLSVSMLYGFWRGGYLTAFSLLPSWVVFGLFCGLLYLAVRGAVTDSDDPLVGGVALCGVVAFVLSLGVSTSLSDPLFRTLADVLPLFRGMRDSQKFVGLLCFAYAFLGGRGVSHLLSQGGKRSDTVSYQRRTLPSRHRVLRAVCICLVLVAPLAYAAPMFGGFSGQVETTTYPESWHITNDYLVGASDDSRTLFLPWHQYMDFSWTGRRIANPAPLFFETPVVASENLEVGDVRSRATDPTHREVAAILEHPADEDVGERLAAVGVEYVILAHEVDYRRYDALTDHEDFSVAVASSGLTLYRNDAYVPGEAPRAGPPIPLWPLVVGSVVSVVTAMLFVVTRREHS
ncbi:alpha-(1-_3)-arabinofuranosyltransferase domain-containing protein [Haladaptatus sp. CMSO5]|uniref:alpha-(1->3)-arabinofuranosyltransferase domain-containing protein n=1 Tax=Haladaptatus sp. CMSO5 TaxID=3120514 RepID=UPI002FCE4B47